MQCGRRAILTGTEEERRPLEQFKEGEIVDGKVAYRGKAGVFVDIGAERNARLEGDWHQKFKLKPNETLSGLTVDFVQPREGDKSGVIKVSFAGLADLVADRTPRRNPQRRRKKQSTEEDSTEQAAEAVDAEAEAEPAEKKEGKKKAKAKPPKPPAEDPFPDVTKGQSLKGRVKNKNERGVFIDVGRKKDALLEPHEKMRLLDWGEEVDVVASEVDHELGRLTVTLPDLEQRVAGRMQTVVALKDLKVGSVVTGHVASFGKMGAFVDFGAEIAAVVKFKESVKNGLQLGEEVKLTLTSIDVDNQKLAVEVVKD